MTAPEGRRAWRDPEQWYGKGWPQMPADAPPARHPVRVVVLLGVLAAALVVIAWVVFSR